MAKAYFKCAQCGESVPVFGNNRKDADRKANWHESNGHLCGDCEEQHRKAENEKAAADNTARGLPALSGSEKQVLWAETIRQSKIELAEKIGKLVAIAQSQEHLSNLSPEDRDAMKAQFSDALEGTSATDRYWLHDVFDECLRTVGTTERYEVFLSVLRGNTRAAWWIDNRDTRIAAIVRNFRDDIDAKVAENNQTPQERTLIQDAQAEALLKPTGEASSSQIAEIKLVGTSLLVMFAEKREDFRVLMRDMGFIWDVRHWVRQMTFKQGDPIDRMADAAHRILDLGYMVRLHDDQARTKAISGEFSQEQTRWVTKATGGDFDGWCKITWPKSDDLYTPAKSILGARYKDGAVYAPPGSILEVADFAGKYGFVLSESPSKMLADHKAALASGIVIAAPKKAPPPVVDDGTKPDLAVEAVGIDADLLD